MRSRIISTRATGKLLFSLLLLALTGAICLGQATAIPETSPTPQPYQPNGEVDMIHVYGNVYMLRTNSRTGNPSLAASIGDDGVLLVDAGFASFGDKISSKLRAQGGAGVKVVINTHWHGDHTGGNEVFGPAATIVARSTVRERLLKQGILEDNGRLLAKRGLPVITFDSALSFFFNNEEVKVIAPPPGHTDGDAVIYFTKSKVLCVGDYFFVDRFPVIDVEESGANLQGYLKNIKFLLDNFPADAKIVPGHAAFWPGELKSAKMSELRSYYNLLNESIALIRKEMSAGKSLVEIQKDGLPERFRQYEERPRFVPIAEWIKTVFNSYAEKSASKQFGYTHQRRSPNARRLARELSGIEIYWNGVMYGRPTRQLSLRHAPQHLLRLTGVD